MIHVTNANLALPDKHITPLPDNAKTTQLTQIVHVTKNSAHSQINVLDALLVKQVIMLTKDVK